MKNYIYINFLFISIVLSSCTETYTIDYYKKDRILPWEFQISYPYTIPQIKEDVSNPDKTSIYVWDAIDRTYNLAQSICSDINKTISEYRDGVNLAFAVDKPMSKSFLSINDGRKKNLTVTENVEFEEEIWEYKLVVTDADSEMEDDKGMAFQMFWNKTPAKGVVIINHNRLYNAELQSSELVRIDFKENSIDDFYEKEIIISSSNIPLPESTEYETAKYEIESYKIFIGKKDRYYDIYGTLNAPNAMFYSDNKGYATVFAGSVTGDYGTSAFKIGLPQNNVNSTIGDVLLEKNSMQNVFKREILYANNISENDLSSYPDIEKTIENATKNTDAPFYFDLDIPLSQDEKQDLCSELAHRIDNISLFSPKEVAEMEIAFKK